MPLLTCVSIASVRLEWNIVAAAYMALILLTQKIEKISVTLLTQLCLRYCMDVKCGSQGHILDLFLIKVFFHQGHFPRRGN